MNFTRDTTSGEEGVALFREIRARHPDLPVILLTAWTAARDRRSSWSRPAPPTTSPSRGTTRKLLATVDNLLELGSADAHGEALRSDASARRAASARARVTTCAASSSPMRCTSACRAGLPGRARRRAGADHRPERRRQGEDRRDRAGQLVGAQRTLRRAQLRRAAGGPDRGRAVRRRGRRLHRRATSAREGSSRPPTAARCSSTRSASCRPTGQMKLLRVLRDRPSSSGSVEQPRAQVKVRVISATNADLPQLIRAGRFREDLYYRLNVIEIARAAARRAAATTSCRWRDASCRPGQASSTPTPRRRCSPTAGRATCASCATASSARRLLARGGAHRRRGPRPCRRRRAADAGAATRRRRRAGPRRRSRPRSRAPAA